ncbi:hypothetical protein LINPERHAP1_LOCUS8808 [Linum perenne]
MSVNPEGSFNGSDNNDENVLIADVVPEELDLMMEMASEDAKEDSTKSEKPDALDGGFLKFFVLSNSVSVEISKVQVSEIWSGAGEVPDEAAGKPWRKSKVRSLDPAALKSWLSSVDHGTSAAKPVGFTIEEGKEAGRRWILKLPSISSEVASS